MKATRIFFIYLLAVIAQCTAHVDDTETRKRRLGHWDPPNEEDVDPDDLTPISPNEGGDGSDGGLDDSDGSDGSPSMSPTKSPVQTPTSSGGVGTNDNNNNNNNNVVSNPPAIQSEEDPDVLTREQLDSSNDGLSVGGAVGIGLAGAALLVGVGYFVQRK